MDDFNRVAQDVNLRPTGPQKRSERLYALLEKKVKRSPGTVLRCTNYHIRYKYDNSAVGRWVDGVAKTKRRLIGGRRRNFVNQAPRLFTE